MANQGSGAQAHRQRQVTVASKLGPPHAGARRTEHKDERVLLTRGTQHPPQTVPESSVPTGVRASLPSAQGQIL